MESEGFNFGISEPKIMSCHPGGDEPACWEGVSHPQDISQLQIPILPDQFRNTSTTAQGPPNIQSAEEGPLDCVGSTKL